MGKKVVLITGGARRIGAGLCKFFNDLNWEVVFTYNSSQTQAKEINGRGLRLNLLDLESLGSVIEGAFEEFGRLDLLINNASVFEKSSLESVKMQDLDEMYKVHLYAPLILSQSYYKYTKQAGLQGHIINMVDSNVHRKKTIFTAYLLSKKSLLDLTYLSASEFAPIVRVNAVLPGFVMQDKHMSTADVEAEIARIPLKRSASVSEIFGTILFLHNNEYLTGQAIAVDGGKNIS
jgi:pteridine reductase